MQTLQGIIQAVGGDPEETHNGELYSAMGYIPKNQRATGLTRPRKGGRGGKRLRRDVPVRPWVCRNGDSRRWRG